MNFDTAFLPENTNNPLSTPVMELICAGSRGDKQMRSNFADYSIFSDDDPHRFTVKELIAKRNFQDVRENKCFGILYGMTLGDAIGARLEFRPVCYGKVFIDGPGEFPDGSFYLKPGQWTDDASVGLCICDSLLSTKGMLNEHDLMQRFLAWWDLGYNNAFRFDDKRHSVGLGGNISMSFYDYMKGKSKDGFTLAGDSKTSGNGSVMRLGAVPVCFWDNINLAQDTAERQSRTTHRGDEAADCCRLLTFLMVGLINGKDLKLSLENLGKDFTAKEKSVQCLANSEIEDNDPDRNWQWKAEDFKYSPARSRANPGYIGSYAMDATAMALHCVWTTNSAKDAILKAVNRCGDADSVGSVTGQIAGAAYGFSDLPAEWITAVNKWDNQEIGLRAFRLYHKIWE
ncbi:ADP-ribosylglycohydrolase [Spirochaetia bacterium]|nr:ADP-ribosylglycohydrolase [Spirochaetia bacterium]